MRRGDVERLLALDHAGGDLGLVAVGLHDGLALLDHVLLSDGHAYAKRNSRDGSDGEHGADHAMISPVG